MDFNDILRQWDDSQKRDAKKKAAAPGPGKKANAPSAEEKAALAAGASSAPRGEAGRAFDERPHAPAHTAHHGARGLELQEDMVADKRTPPADA